MAEKLGADPLSEETIVNNDDMATITSHDQPNIIIAATKSLELETPSLATKQEDNPAAVEDLIAVTKEESSSTDANSLPTAAASSKTATIEDLPNELLSHIFGFLDIPRPSIPLLDEPIFELTDAETADLKASSRVSKRWRQATLPLLFKYARFVVEEPEPKMPVRNLDQEIEPFLEFVNKKELLEVITTFVFVVKDRTITSSDDVPEHSLDIFASFWRLLFKTIDPVELLIIAHPEVLGAFTSCHVYAADMWNFDCPCHYLRLQRPSVLPSQPAPSENAISPFEYPTNSEAHEVVEPLTKTFSVEKVPEDLLKHEPVVATVNDTTEISDDPTDNVPESSSSERKETLDIEPEPRQVHHPQSSVLFEIRPWSSLLLNEGSFIKAYSTYEFWLRQAPSILSDLVGADDQPSSGLISPTIRHMSYVGIFPMASHFSSLSRHLPRLETLYVQLVPRNDILEIPSKMVQVEMEDLWMERNSCYALLMRELFNAPPMNNYKYLEVFESGDAADTDAWHMAVEYVKRAGNGWKVAGDGVFVRDSKDLLPEPADDVPGGDPSSFQGALIRWAWNGTTKLPVSAYPLYDRPMGPVI